MEKPPTPSAEDSRFKTPAEAAQTLVDDRNVWTAALGSRSIEACYAVIGATWAVHEEKALDSYPAMIALTLAIGHVGLNLCLMFVYIRMMDKRLKVVADDGCQWRKEFKNRMDPKSTFPWTRGMERLGDVHQFFKFLFPIAAAVAFIVSLWS